MKAMLLLISITAKLVFFLETDNADAALAKDICLHIASSAPEFVSRKDIPTSVIEEETRIEMGKEDLANKPEQIRAKIVEGRVNKLMAQKCLVEQPFVKNRIKLLNNLSLVNSQLLDLTDMFLVKVLKKKR